MGRKCDRQKAENKRLSCCSVSQAINVCRQACVRILAILCFTATDWENRFPRQTVINLEAKSKFSWSAAPGITPTSAPRQVWQSGPPSLENNPLIVLSPGFAHFVQRCRLSLMHKCMESVFWTYRFWIVLFVCCLCVCLCFCEVMRRMLSTLGSTFDIDNSLTYHWFTEDIFNICLAAVIQQPLSDYLLERTL